MLEISILRQCLKYIQLETSHIQVLCMEPHTLEFRKLVKMYYQYFSSFNGKAKGSLGARSLLQCTQRNVNSLKVLRYSKCYRVFINVDPAEACVILHKVCSIEVSSKCFQNSLLSRKTDPSFLLFFQILDEMAPFIFMLKEQSVESCLVKL